MNPTDAAARELLERWPHRAPGRLALGSPNLMTPEYLATVLDPAGRWVEVSYGSGLEREPLFGLTWQRLADGSCDPRDRCCWSMDEVVQALSSEGASS